MSAQRKAIAFALYGSLIVATALNIAVAFFGSGGRRVRFSQIQVSGNVQRPGMYRVPHGVTRFEILKVAGVNPTSDLMPIDLSAPALPGEALHVGTQQGPVAMRNDSAQAALEFYFGELIVLDREGRSRPCHEGMSFRRGDRLLTEARSQAELSVNAFSRIDADDFTELVFDSMGIDEQGRRIVATYQKSGVCWYKIVYAERAERFTTMTPLAAITAGGTGADVMVEVKPEQTAVHCLEGLALVERQGAEEAINLIAGQSALIFSDGRPLQVQSLAPDVSPRSRFAQLAKVKSDRALQQTPFNAVLYGIPDTYFFISVRYDQGIARLVNIPANTSVTQFVQGAATLSQVLLQMGPALTNTLIERVMDTRVAKYYLVNRDDLIRIAGVLGAIVVNVDARAAAALKMQPGRQKLSGDQLAKFISPSISGWNDARRRQADVLKAFFEGLQSRSIVLTAIAANQLLSGVESNLTAAEIMAEMEKFSQRRTWAFKQFVIPGNEITQDGRTVFEVDLDIAKTQLHTQ